MAFTPSFRTGVVGDSHVANTGTGGQRDGATRSVMRRFLTYLPEGREIPAAQWNVRHRAILIFVAAHTLLLPLFGIAMGWPVMVAITEGLLLAALGAIAMVPRSSRRFRSSIACLACVTSSAILVQFSGGVIEAHFHYFVVVAIIALYQDWIPFLLAIGYVAVDHGLIGSFLPTWIYDHPDAISHPWKWAAIHAIMVLGECAALIVIWKTNEQARAQTERILESTRDGILGLDANGRVVSANRAASTLLARPEARLLGLTLNDLFRPGGDVRIDDMLGAKATLEGTLISKQGDARPMEWSSNAIVERGADVGWVVTFRDTTERRDNLALREANRSLVLANETLEAFSYVVGHDLKEPTRAIENYLAAARAEEDSQRARSLVERAHFANRQLYNLLQGLLEYARVSSTTVRAAPLDVPSILKNDAYRAQFETMLRERSATLDIKPGIPEVQADEVALGHALGNLIVNAVKHNTNPDPRVTVSAGSQDDTMTEIIVEDNGKGFPDDVLQRFSKIRSGRPTTLKGGFGLVVAHRAVQRMRGEMSLERGEAGGARIRLRLPRV